MEQSSNAAGWVWVVVSDHGPEGHYLGLHDQEKNVDFIPAFASKEAASDCYLSLPRKKGEKYEIQAIHIEELMADADKNGFTVALVDHDGKVVTDADALAAGQGGGRSA